MRDPDKSKGPLKITAVNIFTQKVHYVSSMQCIHGHNFSEEKGSTDVCVFLVMYMQQSLKRSVWKDFSLGT